MSPQISAGGAPGRFDTAPALYKVTAIHPRVFLSHGSSYMSELFKTLVAANRILAHEGVVDAYGHVSVRSPAAPARFFMSRSRSPELVSLGDILEFGADGEAVDSSPPPVYAERFIHAAIYEARLDVHAVVHSHAYDVLPFTVTGVPLRP